MSSHRQSKTYSIDITMESLVLIVTESKNDVRDRTARLFDAQLIEF